MSTRADGAGPFGLLLQEYRQAAGIPQEELAERAGLTARGISDLERGVRRSPFPVTVRALADALGLDAAAQTGLMAAVKPRSGVREAPRQSQLRSCTRPVVDRPSRPSGCSTPVC